MDFRNQTLTLISFALGLSLSANAAPLPATKSVTELPKFQKNDKSKNFQWSLNSKLSLLDRQDELSNKKQGAKFEIGIKFRFDLSQYLNFQAKPRLSFAQGFSQNPQSSGARDNSAELIEALTELHDLRFFSLSAGILDLSKNHSSVLMDSSFPALAARIGTGSRKESLGAEILGDAAIISSTSSSRSADSTQDDQKTPQFASYGVSLFSKTIWQRTNLRMSLFQFSNLAASTATESAKLGNTRSQDFSTGLSDFRFKFSGQEIVLNHQLFFNDRFGFFVSAAQIENREAPATFGKAQDLSLGFELGLNRVYQLRPKYRWFKIESDSVVALFNDEKLGTNRQGYLAGIELVQNKDFHYSLEAGERTSIYDSPLIGLERSVKFTMEILNVNF